MEIHEKNHELTLTKFQTKLRDAGKMPDQDRECLRAREEEGKKGRREGSFGSLNLNEFSVAFPKKSTNLRVYKREKEEKLSQTLTNDF